MEITLGEIFVIIFVSSRLPSAVRGVGIKTATFQMLQKHPQLKKCIDSVLQEDQYYGCRVSEVTGQCQGLNRSWGFNQTIEQGYAYAKKVDVQEIQQPPLSLSAETFSIWHIPAVLDPGARIDITMSLPNWPPPEARNPLELFVLHLTNGSSPHGSSRYNQRILFRISDNRIDIIDYVGSDQSEWFSSDGLPSSFRSREPFTLSLLAQSNSIAMFVDDEEVTTFKLKADLRRMWKLFVYHKWEEVDPILIHDIKFTGK